MRPLSIALCSIMIGACAVDDSEPSAGTPPGDEDTSMDGGASGGTDEDPSPDGDASGDDEIAAAGWRLVHEGAAPIRSITRRSDGVLIGPRSSGRAIEVWVSANEGATWTRSGTVAQNPNVGFGDVTMTRVPGTRTIFCAFREEISGTFRVTVTRSDDDGRSWVFDSTPVPPSTLFVGAPFLFIRQNGDLQVYYDSEPIAAAHGRPGHQWIAMRGRKGITGGWTHYGETIVSRQTAPGALSREGMPTVVQLGGDRLMVVVEGVEPFASGGVHANQIHSIQSWDGGRTWDTSLRRTVYRSFLHAGSGRRYNAYAPHAVRVGNGPVGVAFCTDERDGGTPDAASTPPHLRRCRVAYVQTTSTFETWSGPSAVWTATSKNYTPGLFERASNKLLVTIDAFAGRQRILGRP
jgi:hypothetical protein